VTPEEFNKEMCELHQTLPAEEFNQRAIDLMLDTFLPMGYTGVALYLCTEK
jgi:hypothetical protein